MRSETMRAGKRCSAVTRSIIATACSGSRFARSAAVVTPLRTHSRANARNPASSLASSSRSSPTCRPSGVIASGPFISPVGIPSLASGTPGWLIPAQHAREFQRLRIDVEDMPARVHHPDRPFRRNPVEVLPRDAPVAVIDRIERPAGERLRRIIERGIRLRQPRNDLIDRLRALPGFAIGIGAVEVAAIREAPLHALGNMAVPFDETRHQDLVRELRIERVLAPAFEFGERAGAENAPSRTATWVASGRLGFIVRIFLA